MRFTQYLLRGVLCLAALAGVLAAQSIAVLTGASGTGTSIPFYSLDLSNVAGTISPVPAGAFQIIASPDGTKYYILSSTFSGLTVVPNNLRSTTQIVLPSPPVKAVLSGDGKRMVVLTATNSYIVDVGTSTLLNAGGFNFQGTPVDVAFAQDSQTAFILTYVATGGGSGVISAPGADVYINTVNMAQPLTTPSKQLHRTTAGAPTGLVTAPNGLMYLSAPNELTEINPTPFQFTQNPTIQGNGIPQYVQFTSDSHTAVALNKNSSAGSALIFDLVKRTAATVSNTSLGGATIDSLLVASDSRIFALSIQSQTLFELNLSGGFQASSLKNTIPTNSVQAIAVSNEVQARTLYVTTLTAGVTTLNQIDLGTNTILHQTTVPTQAGQALAWAGANPTSGGATIAAFNTPQTVAQGGTSLPLVARVLDALGRPVFGAKVTYAAPGSTTFVGYGSNTADVFTNFNGFAQVLATVQTGAGVQVTANSQGATAANFILNAPGATGPGTCTTQDCGTSTLAIVGGNGQLLPEQTLASALLMARLTDSSGFGIPGQTVVFAVAQGVGSVFCPTALDTFPFIPSGKCGSDAKVSGAIDVVTDANGYAGAKFVSNSTVGQPWITTLITATSYSGAKQTGTATFSIVTLLMKGNNGATVPPPNAIIVAPNLDPTGFYVVRGTAGQTIPGAIKIEVISNTGVTAGMGIPGVALNVSGTGDPTKVPSATCANGTPLTDGVGVASCDLLLGPVPTSVPYGLNVDIGSMVSPPMIVIIVAPGLPVKIKASGDGQSGKAGQQFVLRATVTTSSNGVSASTPLKWSVSPASNGSLSNASPQTDPQGNGVATLTLGTTPGKVVVTLTAGTGSTQASATFTLTVLASATGIQAVAGGDGQTATVLTTFANPLKVQVTDSSNNPVVGATVTFTVKSGSANLTTPAVTGADGTTSTTVTAGATPGPIVITATTAGASASVQFTLNAVAAGPNIDNTSFSNGAWSLPLQYGLSPGLTPCGIAIVRGTGLAPTVDGTVQPNSFIGALPLSLAGVSLTVNQIAAPIFWVSNTKEGGEAVAFQTPCEATGPATVAVQVNGGTKTVENVNVSAYQPGIFEAQFVGVTYAVLLHADGSYVDPVANPAKPGDTLTMFVTGLGPVTPPTGTNDAGFEVLQEDGTFKGQTPTGLIVVGVDGKGVGVTRAQYMPGAIGLYSVSFLVPKETRSGTLSLGISIAAPGNTGARVFSNQSSLFVQ